MISEGGTKREDGVTAEPGRARRGGDGGGKILRTPLRYPGVAVGSHGGFGGWLGGDPFAQCLEEEFQLDGLGGVGDPARGNPPAPPRSWPQSERADSSLPCGGFRAWQRSHPSPASGNP